MTAKNAKTKKRQLNPMEVEAMKDMETRRQFVELRAAGWSYERIADKLKTSKTTLISWAKQYGAEIANLKTLELDALMERLAASRRARVESLAEILTAARADLKARLAANSGTFAVTDDKLVSLIVKLSASLHGEETDAAFKVERTEAEVKPDAFVFEPEELTELLNGLEEPNTKRIKLTSEAWAA